MSDGDYRVDAWKCFRCGELKESPSWKRPDGWRTVAPFEHDFAYVFPDVVWQFCQDCSKAFESWLEDEK